MRAAGTIGHSDPKPVTGAPGVGAISNGTGLPSGPAAIVVGL